MAKLTLKLLVTGYRQPKARDNDAAGFTQRTSGEVFEAVDAQEYDRLIEIKAAQDPQKAQEQEAERLEAQRAALEAQQAELQVQIDRLQDPSKLTGKALDEALTDRGLSTDGKADEKRARLSEAVAAEQGT